jgi:hypothetical protein
VIDCEGAVLPPRRAAIFLVLVALGIAAGGGACSSTPDSTTKDGSSGAVGGFDGGSGSGGGMPSVPGSPGFDLVEEGNTYTAVSRTNPNVKVEVDCDDQADDGHYFSITPIIDGRRLDGPLWETNIGLILHNDDASFGLTDANRCVSVDVVGDRLVTKFLSGTYRNLFMTGDDKPVPMNASFGVDSAGRLVAELTGLYYILPTANDTNVLITTNGTVVERTMTPTTETLEYFDNVTFLEVTDPTFGHFTIETNVVLLQLQHELAYGRFEFDLDHTFKDKGQESVSSKMTF